MTNKRTTNDRDNHATHIWMFEPASAFHSSSGRVLTEDGLDQIVNHKYKAGTYTALDLWLNSSWQYLTDQLPLDLAPNAVTSLGGCFAILSYLVTAQFSFDMVHASPWLSLTSGNGVPDWVLVFNGLCLIAYYTLDCMDGKQARRTNSSSPLGQLFDHGVDCLANLSHLSLMQTILGLEYHQYLMLQVIMQLGFFQAQLEEYYTRSLPHAAGNFGTTEVLYGMAMWSIITGLSGMMGMVGPRQVYSQELSWLTNLVEYLPGAKKILLGAQDDVPAASMGTCQVRHLIILLWVYGFLPLSLLSFLRLLPSLKHGSRPKAIGSALSKLLSPIILCTIAYVAQPLSEELGGIRYPSLAIGLCFCIITIKLIVFGMARMAYASLQWADIVPLMLVVFLHQQNPTQHWRQLLYPLAAAGYVLRLVWWTQAAVEPLCRRMNIKLFQINSPKSV